MTETEALWNKTGKETPFPSGSLSGDLKRAFKPSGEIFNPKRVKRHSGRPKPVMWPH